MPKLGRTTPCAECPWLRSSMRGYLGVDEAEHFYRTSVTQEQEMPCHSQIDYEDADWMTTQLPDVDLCAGNLIYYRNNCKRPRNKKLHDAVDAVKNSKHVFSWGIEFMRHHMPFEKNPEEITKANTRAHWPYDEATIEAKAREKQ